jgi:hypothetical protein
MTFSRNLVIWPVAAALAIAAGSAAVLTSGGGPDVLTGQQASERLVQARASLPPPPDDTGTLASDEWFASVPSAGLVARCASGAMQLVRWSGAGLRDLRPGPAATVSGAVSIDDDRVTFTGRCVDGMPTGSFRWQPIGTHRKAEPAERMRFGKWVNSGLYACRAEPDQPGGVPAECRKVPLLTLSVPSRDTP